MDKETIRKHIIALVNLIDNEKVLQHIYAIVNRIFCES